MMMTFGRKSVSTSTTRVLLFPQLQRTLILFLLVSHYYYCQASSSSTASAYEPWTCDDMTPNLCSDLEVSTGYITTQDDLKVAYWKYSQKHTDETAATTTTPSPPTNVNYPIIVINGGPGMSHNYDLPLKQLACRDSSTRQVIFYDQAGTGKSKLPPNTTVKDDYPFLLDADYYANIELPALLDALLEVDNNKFHIVGDSWGTMIAMKYAIESSSNNHDDERLLVSMTLNGPIPKSSDYIDYSWDTDIGSIGKLPPYVLKRLKIINQTQDFLSDEFIQLNGVVFQTAYTRNGMLADCAIDSLLNINEDINNHMWSMTGTDYFNIDASLKDFNLYAQLHKLDDLPMLLTCGEYDMVRPKTLEKMVEVLPGANTKIYIGSGHVSLMDVTAEVLDTTYNFITSVESGGNDGNGNGRGSTSTTIASTDDDDDDEANNTNHVGWKIFISLLALTITFYIGKRFGTKSTYREIDEALDLT